MRCNFARFIYEIKVKMALTLWAWNLDYDQKIPITTTLHASAARKNNSSIGRSLSKKAAKVIVSEEKVVKGI